MSVIAWDGLTIAADRQMTSSDMRMPCEKLIDIGGGVIVGFTGDMDKGLLMVEWYRGGADPAKYPAFQGVKDELARLIVFRDGRVFEYQQMCASLPVIAPMAAFGSGRDFAIGAMAAGATADEAVKIASEYSVGCGLGVTAFKAPRHAPEAMAHD